MQGSGGTLSFELRYQPAWVLRPGVKTTDAASLPAVPAAFLCKEMFNRKAAHGTQKRADSGFLHPACLPWASNGV